MIDLYAKLAIPDTCYLGKKIFKKLFYENAQLNATDKKAFTQDIGDIEWKYTLKPDTINIARYANEEREYDEVAVIQVNLKEPQRYKRIAQIIQRAIPYPLLVVLAHESVVALNVAAKRINRADRERIMVEEFQETDWIDLESPASHEQDFLDSLAVTSFSYNNFFEFYSDLTERIVGLNCAEFSGIFTAEASNPGYGGRAEILERVSLLQQKQTELRAALKKESQFSRKVELNMELKKVGEQINTQKGAL